jgi:predicted nicotinamide N-methyase
VVLELGCGLGLPALVAARLGARVIATDCHPDVPAFLERNAALAEVAIEYQALDWRVADELDALRERHGPFDLVLGSDLLYEAELANTLGPALARLCGPRTRVLLADPGRPHLQEAVSVIEACGFRCEVEIAAVPASLDPAVHGARGPAQQELFLLALALTA